MFLLLLFFFFFASSLVESFPLDDCTDTALLSPAAEGFHEVEPYTHTFSESINSAGFVVPFRRPFTHGVRP